MALAFKKLSKYREAIEIVIIFIILSYQKDCKFTQITMIC